MPNLLALFNARKEKPQVQLFEGIAGVKQIYEKIYASREVLFFGTPSEIIKIDPEALWSFIKRVKESNLQVKDLMADIPEHQEYVNRAKAEKKYEIRFLPKGASFFTDSAIFGDNVVFFSFRPVVFGVMISSKDISASLRVLYELAWQQAISL